MIINHELGLAQNENSLQGSFIIEELTDLVEEAVLAEFDRITGAAACWVRWNACISAARFRKNRSITSTKSTPANCPLSGQHLLSDDGSPTTIPNEVIRSTEAEKRIPNHQIQALQQRNAERGTEALISLQRAAIRSESV